MNPRQCEFCDKELLPESEYDACDPCITLMTKLINDPPVRTIQPEDDWYTCDRCGAETGDADICEPICPRCRQLAEIEREIGRAVIGQAILEADYERIPDSTDNTIFDAYANHMAQVELKQWQAVAQWRKLHAEGAEAEAATERQEGER